MVYISILVSGFYTSHKLHEEATQKYKCKFFEMKRRQDKGERFQNAEIWSEKNEMENLYLLAKYD